MFPHFDTPARIAMMQAHDTARELGHPEVGPDHVLLGLLADVRGDAYAVLTRHGLQYAVARDLVVADHARRSAPTDSAPDPTGDVTDSAAEDDLDRDREALLALGIDLDTLRTTVRDRFGEDLTEGWGERRPRRGERGGPRRRGPGPRFGPESPEDGPGFGPGGPGRGRRGPRSGRFGGAEGLSPAMREVMVDLMRHTRVDTAAAKAEQLRELADQIERGERPERGERRRGGRPQLGADRLLAAILRSDDPAVAAVVAAADDPAALRAEVEALAGHATA